MWKASLFQRSSLVWERGLKTDLNTALWLGTQHSPTTLHILIGMYSRAQVPCLNEDFNIHITWNLTRNRAGYFSAELCCRNSRCNLWARTVKMTSSSWPGPSLSAFSLKTEMHLECLSKVAPHRQLLLQTALCIECLNSSWKPAVPIAHWEMQTEFLWKRWLSMNLLTLALRPGALEEEEEEVSGHYLAGGFHWSGCPGWQSSLPPASKPVWHQTGLQVIPMQNNQYMHHCSKWPTEL